MKIFLLLLFVSFPSIADEVLVLSRDIEYSDEIMTVYLTEAEVAHVNAHADHDHSLPSTTTRTDIRLDDLIRHTFNLQWQIEQLRSP